MTKFNAPRRFLIFFKWKHLPGVIWHLCLSWKQYDTTNRRGLMREEIFVMRKEIFLEMI